MSACLCNICQGNSSVAPQNYTVVPLVQTIHVALADAARADCLAAERARMRAAVEKEPDFARGIPFIERAAVLRIIDGGEA